MRKRLIQEKREELRSLTKDAFIDRVVNYHDQTALNTDGTHKRDRPLGYIAQSVKNYGVDISDRQYYGMIDDFAKTTVPNLKVVGTSFRGIDANNVAVMDSSSAGVVTTYNVNYILAPEPENEYDPNAVKVMIESVTGEPQHVGYLGADLVQQYRISEPMRVDGTMVDHSNGRMKNVSFRIPMDMEALHALLDAQGNYHEKPLIEFDSSVTIESDTSPDFGVDHRTTSDEQEDPLALTDADLEFARESVDLEM